MCKKFILNFIFVLQIFNLADAQEVMPLVESDTTQPKQATIVLYRPYNMVASAVSLKLYVNGQLTAKLKNNTYYVLEVPAGSYDISARMETEPHVLINAEAGKTYYIKCAINMGVWSGRPQLDLIDPTFAKEEIEKGTLQQILSTSDLFKTYKNRISFHMGGGKGFESFEVFKTTDNETVTLSTGGGFNFGIQYGNRISKNFDLAFEMLYQISSLSINLKNGSGTFSRGVFTVTPSLVIPDKNESMNWRIGAGPGVYFGGTMKIDGSQIPGGRNFTFKYKSAVGFHANFIWDIMLGEASSIFLGLKYYNVTYKFSSSEGGVVPIDRKLKEPNGSGLDFLVGLSIYF